MKDSEINIRLALAIGWGGFDIATKASGRTAKTVVVYHTFYWREFDYIDWATIAPIAEKYDCFPEKSGKDLWVACQGHEGTSYYATTPQGAIALAVIRAKKS